MSSTLCNQQAWDALTRQGHRFCRPATPDELADPLTTVDPAGWLGDDIRGWHVLCLAAGGGRQGPLYAAAGGQVTVVDLSAQQLAIDREVAQRHRLRLQTVQTSMDQLSMFDVGQYVHSLESLVGGICAAGFAVEAVVEPAHGDPQAEVGSFSHRCHWVAPYLRVRARRGGMSAKALRQRL